MTHSRILSIPNHGRRVERGDDMHFADLIQGPGHTAEPAAVVHPPQILSVVSDGDL